MPRSARTGPRRSTTLPRVLDVLMTADRVTGDSACRIRRARPRSAGRNRGCNAQPADCVDAARQYTPKRCAKALIFLLVSAPPHWAQEAQDGAYFLAALAQLMLGLYRISFHGFAARLIDFFDDDTPQPVCDGFIQKKAISHTRLKTTGSIRPSEGPADRIFQRSRGVSTPAPVPQRRETCRDRRRGSTARSASRPGSTTRCA